MSLDKLAKNEKAAKKSRRGSTNNKNRLAAFGQGSDGASADWGGCDSERLQSVIVSITGVGGAITVGLSRDKGAHFLTLLLDEEKQTLWFNGDADLDAELDAVLATLDGME